MYKVTCLSGEYIVKAEELDVFLLNQVKANNLVFSIELA